ncbi:MAG: hypothetical protein Q9195_006569 [Heterodermia aff. obscurata]
MQRVNTANSRDTNKVSENGLEPSFLSNWERTAACPYTCAPVQEILSIYKRVLNIIAKMYASKPLSLLLPILFFLTITTATPISPLDHSITHPKPRYHAIASLSHPLHHHPSLPKRSVPWTQLGEGWLGATIDFFPILPASMAAPALTKLYTGVAERCLSGMLTGSRTPSNSVVLRIGLLNFIAEATDTMDWDVIYQFALKMREMVERETAPMYTMMFAHVAGQAVMFSVRVAGVDGSPIL